MTRKSFFANLLALLISCFPLVTLTNDASASALQEKEHHAEAVKHYEQGVKLQEAGQTTEAEREFLQAIALDSLFIQAHRAYIDLKRARGEKARDELLKEYEALAVAHPMEALYAYCIGKIYAAFEGQEALRKCAEYFQKAIDLNPNFPWGYFGLAYVHLQRNETDKAIQGYEKAIELEPSEPLFYSQLAYHYDTPKAIQLLEKAIERFPDEPQFYSNLAYRYRDHDPEKYRSIARRLIQKFPHSGEAAFMAFDLAENTKDEKERIAAFEAYVHDYPSGPNVSWAYDELLRHCERTNPLKGDSLARAILAKPVSGEDRRAPGYAYSYLFRKALKSGNPVQVKAIAEEVLNSNLPDPNLYSEFGSVYLDSLNDPQRAILFYEKALAHLKPEDLRGTVLFGSVSDEHLASQAIRMAGYFERELGKALVKAGRPQEALAHLDTAVAKSGGPSAEIWHTRAEALDGLGRKGEAFDAAVRSLALTASPETKALLLRLAREAKITGDPMAGVWKARLENAKPALDFTLPDFNARQVKLSDHRGKIVLLNFWFPT